MLFYESNSRDPYFNLAMEDRLFSTMEKGKSLLMLWQNSNTVVVGKYQNTVEEINTGYVEENGVRVARRLSGGGAVYHDDANLNYTIITDHDDESEFNFMPFAEPVIRVLKGYGIEAEFNGRNDLLIGDRKFSGCSQYARGGRLMHHGCIMLDTDMDKASNALKIRDAKIKSKGAKSVVSRITTINEHAVERITMERFKRDLAASILADGNAKRRNLTPEDFSAIEKLVNEKYSTWEWNYGFRGDYEMTVEKKFPSGIVSAAMNVEEGRITGIKLSGDFFGNGDIEDVERGVAGCALNEELRDRLNSLNIPEYMHGISVDDIYGLLVY